MKDFNNPPVFIIALNHDEDTQTEREVLADRFGIKSNTIKSLKGCYKGSCENSYLVSAQVGRPAIDTVLEEFHQESALFLDQNRNAFLVRRGAGLQYIGQWLQKPKQVAVNQPAYTHDPSTDVYYVVQPTH